MIKASFSQQGINFLAEKIDKYKAVGFTDQAPQSVTETLRYIQIGDTKYLLPGAGAGSGTVTTVNTGGGLTGGPITTSGTISINRDVVDTWYAAVNSIVDLTNNQLIDGKKDFKQVPRVFKPGDLHNLPEEYQEVTYVESNGHQYLDTGIKLENGFICQYKASFNSHGGYVVGSHNLSAPYSRQGFYLYQPNGWQLGLYDYYPNIQYETVLNVPYEVEFSTVPNDAYGKINGQLVVKTTSAYEAPQGTVKIFRTGEYDTFANAKLYYAILFNNQNEKVREYIFCYKKDTGVVGLYDLVNNTFITTVDGSALQHGPIPEDRYVDVLTDADFAVVAKTGNYNDLENKPNIPQRTSQLQNDSNFTTKQYVDETVGEIQIALAAILGNE